jgi:hypothetical protein
VAPNAPSESTPEVKTEPAIKQEDADVDTQTHLKDTSVAQDKDGGDDVVIKKEAEEYS